jgi:hypothetical protein
MTKRQMVRRWTFVLTLMMHAKRRFVVQRVIVMSYCHLAQIKGLAIRRTKMRH